MSYLFNRQISLIVTDPNGQGLELSGNYAVGQSGGAPVPLQQGFHIVFQVSHYTTDTPNSLTLRIYNLASATAQQIQQEFTQVVLRAGYPDNFGIIFKGTIKQVQKGASAGSTNVSGVRVGQETPADTYLDIFASDGDQPYNWGLINQTLAAGHTPNDVANAISKAMAGAVPAGFAGNDSPTGQTSGTQDAGGFDANPLPDGMQQRPSPRGRVMYGMARDHADILADTNGLNWSIQGGVLQWLPYSSYKPGDAIVLTSQTGLIGLPQQTQDGIAIRSLLNPAIGPGQRVQINNKSIQRAAQDQAFLATNYLPPTQDDGFYKVIYCDHTGDTRGQPWYTDMICLTTDGTAPISGAVLGVPIPP